jgi:type VI secretion system protein ImpC
MAKSLSFGKIDVTLSGGPAGQAGELGSERPFRIAVLGDFSGRSSRSGPEPVSALASRRPLLVDRDNFDNVLARLGVEVHLPLGDTNAGHIAIRFRELDDFHPDRIVQQVEVFESLRETRAKLANPKTFAAAAAQVRSWAKPPALPSPTASPPPGAPTAANLLDQILGAPIASHDPAPAPGAINWDTFLHNLVAPFLVPGEDPLQAEMIAHVDAATAALLRAILHHPHFQAVEAAWRSLHFLIRRLNTDEQFKLYVLDITRDDLAADLGAEDLRSTSLYKLLVEQTVGTPGGEPWTLLVGNYTFGPDPADVELLGRLAKVARQARAPFLTAANPAILGLRSLAETPDPDDWPREIEPDQLDAWAALRRLPEAASLGLALPRFLLRLPYGKDTDTVEAFPFEELPEGAGHEAYLWGNSAFAWAYLMGETFNRQGWQVRPGTLTEVDRLPLHVYTKDGNTEYKPCAEVILSLRAAEKIMDQGVMPLLSVQNRDSARLAGFRSAADPPQPLAGRWV